MNIKLELETVLAELSAHPDRAKKRVEHIYYYVSIPDDYTLVGCHKSRLPALVAIGTERNYQDERWGQTQSSGRPGNGERTLDEFALYIAGHADKLRNFCTEFADPESKLHEVRKIAALCVWCMEQHGAVERNMRNDRS